uniref:Positive regulator of purine utilization n=2 Tax=Talaromyces marneffei TaxID=37727 RepID=A0A093XWI4_TALMA
MNFCIEASIKPTVLKAWTLLARLEATARSPATQQSAASASADLEHSVNQFEDGVVDDYQGPSPISAMGAAIPIDGQQSVLHQDEFNRRSSSLSLAQEVTHSVMPLPHRDKASSQARRETNHMVTRPRPSNRGRTNTMVQAHFALPPREIADKLLDSYFSSVHIFYPWVHSVAFWEECDRLWTVSNGETQTPFQNLDIGLGGTNYTKHIFFCTLNAEFAIGYQFTDFSLNEKENLASVFFGRMKDLLNDALDGGSISHVQALLLAGHYLLCTQYPSRCWNIVGTACRMAVGLGLQASSLSSPVP